MDSAAKNVVYSLVFISFSVYSVKTQSPDISSGAYVGCYRDIGQYATFTKPVNATRREPASCRERCRNESAAHIGLWGGEKCWCAYVLNERTGHNRTSNAGLIEKVDDSQCNTSCADNSSLSCGGFTDEADHNIFSVYSVCPKTKYGEQRCSFSCNCKDDNHCSVGGVCPGQECAPGWKLSVTQYNRAVCNADVNECRMQCNSTHTSNCHNCSSQPNERCRNTRGSYECICETGFQREDADGRCEDVDECTQSKTLCDQMCNNTAGSYFCSCVSGFSLDQIDRRKCIDIDECQTSNGNCNQTCTNTYGSYICSCLRGYWLHNDRHTCEDINECIANNGNCSQQCINIIGSYKCGCDDGYELQSDRHSCNDTDECSRNLSKCNHNCTNTVGSYKCSCFPGFKLKDENICIDVDECEKCNGGCQHYCSNTPGSFSCSCQPGFRLISEACVAASYYCTDIDECSERSSYCEQNCNNAIGNYTCGCHSGFQLQDNGLNCSDVNECDTKDHSCTQLCSNLIGSYSCSCYTGYTLVGKYYCERDSSNVMVVGFALFSIIIAILLAAIFNQWQKIRQLTSRNLSEFHPLSTADVAAIIRSSSNKQCEEIIPNIYAALTIQETMDAQDPYTAITVPVKSPEATDTYQTVEDLNLET